MGAEPRSGRVNWRAIALIALAALPGIAVVVYLAITTGYWWLLVLAVAASAWSAHGAHRAGKPFLPRHE